MLALEAVLEGLPLVHQGTYESSSSTSIVPSDLPPKVLGASDIPFDEMTKLDYLYVTNRSLAADMRLLLPTLPSLTRVRTAY